MIGIDTNILIRYVTADHPEQSRRARKLVDGRPVFVAITVMLEAEWVLRSVYGFSASDVAGALRAFAGLPMVSVEYPDVLSLALDRAETGMDFADALHLGKAESCEAFLTFDGPMIKKARALGIGMVNEP